MYTFYILLPLNQLSTLLLYHNINFVSVISLFLYNCIFLFSLHHSSVNPEVVILFKTSTLNLLVALEHKSTDHQSQSNSFTWNLEHLVEDGMFDCVGERFDLLVAL